MSICKALLAIVPKKSWLHQICFTFDMCTTKVTMYARQKHLKEKKIIFDELNDIKVYISSTKNFHVLYI